MEKAIFIVEKTNTGYSAFCDQYNAATTASTYPELRDNMLESLNLVWNAEGLKKVESKDIQVQLDLQQFFEFYNEINVLGLCKRIGINNALMSQYLNGKKTPSQKQVKRILEGIKSFGSELAAIDIV